MSRISINADLTVGIDIIDACHDAVTLSTKLNVNVRFDFNGVLVIARPNADPYELATEYRRVQSEEKIKIATVI